MNFIGIDLGGANSRACVRDEAGKESFKESAHPERASSVLLPLIRKEHLLAGDEALRNERGSGAAWPPLAMTAPSGWSHSTPPMSGGRVLLATVWQHLNSGSQWPDLQWHPPDNLPVLSKPTPADCLTAEAKSVLKQTLGDSPAQAVVAIPNQLPEESQESLLNRLPTGSRLVWRSVAAAMSWADTSPHRMDAGKHLVVLDAGLHGVEISLFEFRHQDTNGRIFQVPVRRHTHIRQFKTEPLLADNPAPFSHLRPNLTGLEVHVEEIYNAVRGHAHFLICGPLAKPFAELLKLRFPQFNWPYPDAQAVARGSCLFAWRLAHHLPTYLDTLPSLELFTLTEEHEPNWLPLIPPECEVSGGQPFQQVLARRIFIEKDTTRLASWLQRSGESGFRKLSTDLPVQAARNAWVDLNVSARSAGGFARVWITPSQGQFHVFGTGQSVLLNWQSMERIARDPGEKWPAGTVKFGWPACGKLYAHRPIFDDFLVVAEQMMAQALEHRVHAQRMTALGHMKLRVATTIAPHLAGVSGAGGDAAPVNLLVCFSTDAPCQFMDGGSPPRITNPLPGKEVLARRIAKQLWQRIKTLNSDPRATSVEINALIYILGRMGGYAPDAFQNFLAGEIHPVSNTWRLFAAGRVLQTLDHGRHLFATVNEKAAFGQVLNNNWLRMLVYVLYQRPDILRECPREHLVATAELCFDVFDNEVEKRNVRIRFINSLRVLALLLRARRHPQARDFFCSDSCPRDEARLAKHFRRALLVAGSMRLRPGPRTLVERVSEWLDFTASTDEMPPIAPADEEGETENDDD